MFKNKQKENKKKQEKEIKSNKENSFKKFFLNFFWVGLVIVLITIIVDLNFENKFSDKIIYKTIIELFKTAGISILLGGLFTWASETQAFTNKIKGLLTSVILKRDFLSNLDSESKKSTLQSIIKPSTFEMNSYGSVTDYYQFYINKTMEISKKNIRSDYRAEVQVSYDDSKKIVKYKTYITYCLYPTKEGFGSIELGFETVCGHKGELISAEISCADGKKYKFKDYENSIIKQTINGITSDYLKFELTKDKISEIDFDNQKFLLVSLCLLEYGYDHWAAINFRTLQPTSRFTYAVSYPEDFKCSSYCTYGSAIDYDVDDQQENRLTISTSQWLNDGAGVSIVISKEA